MASNELKNSIVVGSMPGRPGRPDTFLAKYPEQPSQTLKSLDELKHAFPKKTPIAFYYPSVPLPERDERAIDILKHYKNSVMLFEKPSHNTALEAAIFAKTLEKEGLYQRVLVGMHDTVHPSRAKLLDLVKTHRNEITRVSVVFNYPKDPEDEGSWRHYHPVFGGAMLDLGIYVTKCAEDISQTIGFELQSFEMKGRKIVCKRDKNGVDTDFSADLKYTYGEKKIALNLETSIAPGNSPRAEVKILLENGDEIVMNSFVHPHHSTGIFNQHANGTVTRVMAPDQKSSYAYQLQLTNDLLKELTDWKEVNHPNKDLTIGE